MSDWFNVAAMFIMFREALEAAIIISVLLQLLIKLKMPELKRWVWFGAIAGLAISFVLGLVFVLVFYLANTQLLSTKASSIFKGVISWVASLLVTYVAFALLKFYNLERKWRHKLQDAVSRQKQVRSHRWAMFLLAGSTTLREGIESVLFLTGVTAGSSVKAVVIPGIVGIILGALLGVLVYYTGRSIKSLKWFFIVSSVILLFIAAGLVVNGIYYFQAAELFGTMWPYEFRPWSNDILWDTSGCCDPNTNEFWSLIRALFGYQAQPTNLMLLYYCLYWGMTLALLVYKRYNGSLTDQKEAAIADLQSFAHHGLEPSSDAASSVDSDKLGSKASSNTDLEAGIPPKEEEMSKDETGEAPAEVVAKKEEQAAAPAGK